MATFFASQLPCTIGMEACCSAHYWAADLKKLVRLEISYAIEKESQTMTEVQDVPVKKADIPNEPYATTQPLSVGMPQIGAQHLTEADMWGMFEYS